MKPETGTTGSFEIDAAVVDPQCVLGVIFELRDKEGHVVYARALDVNRIEMTTKYLVHFEVVDRPN